MTTNLEHNTMTRRQFLVRSAATAAGTFMSIALPGALTSGTAQAAMTEGTAAFTPSIWFTITPDGKTTMHILKAEMGQHIGTGLAQIIAEELEVKWEDVRLDTPLESVENFAIYGLAYTVNSGSVTTEFDRIVARRRRWTHRADRGRRQGARRQGRRLLRGERPRDRQGFGPLDRLRRDPAEGQDRSQVRLPRRLQEHQAEGARAATRSSASRSRRSTSRPRPTARPSTAWTCSCRTWCTARWSSRARATAPRCSASTRPRRRKIPGFIKAVKIDDSLGKCTGWVVALAETFPAAMKASKALKVKVDPGPLRQAQPERHHGGVLRAADRTPRRARPGCSEGDVDKGLAAGRQGAGYGVHHRHGLPRDHGADQCHRAAVRGRRLARLYRHAEHVVRAHDA